MWTPVPPKSRPDGTHVWVANSNDNTVSELNALTGTAGQTIAVGALPQGVSSDGSHVWVTNINDNTVSEIEGIFLITASSLLPAIRGTAPTARLSKRPISEPAPAPT